MMTESEKTYVAHYRAEVEKDAGAQQMRIWVQIDSLLVETVILRARMEALIGTFPTVDRCECDHGRIRVPFPEEMKAELVHFIRCPRCMGCSREVWAGRVRARIATLARDAGNALKEQR